MSIGLPSHGINVLFHASTMQPLFFLIIPAGVREFGQGSVFRHEDVRMQQGSALVAAREGTDSSRGK
jgi:hypothetical protein